MLINRLNPPPKFAHIERVAHRVCLIADQLNVVFDVPFEVVDAIDRGIEGGFILSMTRMLL
jgi:hypothetical protein